MNDDRMCDPLRYRKRQADASLLEYIPDESVDLIYLDPPFISNRSYNVLFKDESGKAAYAQVTA